MRLAARVVATMALAGAVLCGMGCGGLGASGSISPASFLLPGIGQNSSEQRPHPQERIEQMHNVDEPSSPQVAAYSADLVQ